MTLLTVTRGGQFLRVVEPGWAVPFDASWSVKSGGRWNEPGTYRVLYLNTTRQAARRNVHRLLAGKPYGPEDLDPATAPVLVSCALGSADYADIVTDDGIAAAGLPVTYPQESDGSVVPHEVCWPIGVEAHDSDLAGVACRSAAPGATLTEEEVAVFVGEDPLNVVDRWTFDRWFWSNQPLPAPAP